MHRIPAIQRNIALIGMPGSGKSTSGVLLAKHLGMGFIDTDLLIQERAGRTLQDIVDHDGYLALRAVEEQVLLGLNVERQVISTGGSAVYSERAMAHLRSIAFVVFLQISLDEMIRRIGDYSTRGLARRPRQSLQALFDERQSLYLQHADLVVEGEQGAVIERVTAMLGAQAPQSQ